MLNGEHGVLNGEHRVPKVSSTEGKHGVPTTRDCKPGLVSNGVRLQYILSEILIKIARAEVLEYQGKNEHGVPRSRQAIHHDK